MRIPIEFDLAEIEELAGLGLTQEEIADSLGVSERTISNRLSDDANFAAAYKRGCARGKRHVANTLRTQSDSGNVAATIFYLKCRAGWKDTQVVEHSGEVRFAKIEHVIVDPK